MAATTQRQLAQDILKQMNGGRRNVTDMGPSEEFVMQLITQSRDVLTTNELSKNQDREVPDPVFYTSYEGDNALPLSWDDREGIAYFTLPNGNPIHIRWYRGLIVRPSMGKGAWYVPAPKGWCAGNPEYSFCEGKYVWEIRTNGKVVIPNMPEFGMPSSVNVEVIESGVSDPDSPLKMPDRYVVQVRAMVLEALGMPRDMKIDYRKESDQ